MFINFYQQRREKRFSAYTGVHNDAIDHDLVDVLYHCLPNSRIVIRDARNGK